MKCILAVETSCDDTSVAIVREDGFVESNQVASQDFVHQAYGGVVPELASRNHAYYLLPLIEDSLAQLGKSWDEIDCLAVTNRPGLVGSLIVGLVTVKTLSLILQKPYVAVNHIEGHILSPFLWDSDWPRSDELKFPFLALIASGGHTFLFRVEDFGKYHLIGKTLDDAAGEVLDKFARSLGLSYPGGAEVDRLSQGMQLGRYVFPRLKLKKDSLDFSFSGLKTKALQLIQKENIEQIFQKDQQSNKELISQLCADYQEAVVDQMMMRVDQCVERFDFASVVMAGGVSANSRLRERGLKWSKEKGIPLIVPPLRYCTDNAAMIAQAGFSLFSRNKISSHHLNCSPYSLPEDFIVKM